ncbi:hypothetical protein I9H06_26570 (plasmid) [Pseudomonas tremae]|uniref:Uncharacterized protein n=1 Tax=Pseudomonas syringae pv. aptata TaxID=83167 RepID=A0A3M5WRM9_PSEAP|nr:MULTISPECIES: hypothetical protein [Pseudomonas syringae group]RMU73291.1 hypothetical protein ALP24_03808 [Pseudomonas syringae pv. aptata]MCF5715854.1 hypothetical protein [Pseudomonas tremae]RMM78186.1 hypothetical protein ALQ71_101061 [Pseudomonas coronafaciens pv. striafaciens]RMR76681.1 hypothetical protein ALP81_200163 [Pseudomonas savastanoi pv. fraxini]UQB34489.1 hypothetical protein I9H06_26570 [Pseudomonas tremae]
MKIGPNSKLQQLKALIKANVEKKYSQKVDDAHLYEWLMSGTYDTLEGAALDALSDVSDEEKQSLLNQLYDELGPGDQIVTFPEDNPVWLKVTPHVPGRLPSKRIEDELWIRLDTVNQIIPKPAFAIGDDVRTYQFVIQVQANDKLYEITATRFKGKSVYAKLPKVMQLVSDAVRNLG